MNTKKAGEHLKQEIRWVKMGHEMYLVNRSKKNLRAFIHTLKTRSQGRADGGNICLEPVEIVNVLNLYWKRTWL